MNAADMEVLEFERTRFDSPGRKEEVVMQRFGFRLTTYYAHLDRIIDSPEADVYDPTHVRRLRRLRDARRAQRGQNRKGWA